MGESDKAIRASAAMAVLPPLPRYSGGEGSGVRG
jgi:hypothetical protein